MKVSMQKKQSLWWHQAMPYWEVNTLIWRNAFKQVFPFFLVTHLSMIIISLYAPELIIISKKSPIDPLNSASFSVIWHTWNRYDSQHYVSIAQQSYKSLGDAAFFPLFPWLMRFVDIGIHNTIISGLLLSSLAGLVLMIVMYQLALEEFGEQLARRAVLYLLAFPTAFFLWAIYPESIFLCLSLLCFYAMKHQHWWLAGICGLFAAMDRPTGILLFLPFCIEYLRINRAIRVDIVSILLIPLGLGLFALYCAHHYGDPLAFIRAQNGWKHHLALPGYALFRALQIVYDQGPDIRLRVFLSSSLDFIPDVLVLVLLILTASMRRFRLGAQHWAYFCFAAGIWLFANMEPGYQPLMGFGRNMLVVFPIFFVLARLGNQRWIHLLYLSISGTLCILWCVQFVTGYRVI
jgi:Gpi18-like mannosyltransferase